MLTIYLKEWCKQKGIKSKDMADKLGITPTALSNINKNVAWTSRERLEAAAEFLGIEANALFINPLNIDNTSHLRDGVTCPHCGYRMKLSAE